MDWLFCAVSGHPARVYRWTKGWNIVLIHIPAVFKTDVLYIMYSHQTRPIMAETREPHYGTLVSVLKICWQRGGSAQFKRATEDFISSKTMKLTHYFITGTTCLPFEQSEPRLLHWGFLAVYSCEPDADSWHWTMLRYIFWNALIAKIEWLGKPTSTCFALFSTMNWDTVSAFLTVRDQTSTPQYFHISKKNWCKIYL